MHSRLKELAKEAGYYLYDLTETHERKTVETDSTDEWITLEKFAELIVRECGVALIPMLRDMVSRGQAFDLIKQHFGVEE